MHLARPALRRLSPACRAMSAPAPAAVATSSPSDIDASSLGKRASSGLPPVTFVTGNKKKLEVRRRHCGVAVGD